MTFGFLAPFALFTLALTGLVLWLHARRKRRMVQPSLRLWRDLQLPSGASKATRQLPPFSWPLVLQLLAVLFAALAFAHPYWGAKPAQDQVYILDAQSDLAEQKAILAKALSGPAQSVSLILASETPRLLAAELSPQDIDLEATFAQITPSAQVDWDGTARRLGMLSPSQERQITLLSAQPLARVLAEAGALRQELTAAPEPVRFAFAARPMQTPYRFAFTFEATLPKGISSTDLVIGYTDGSGDLAPLPFFERTLLGDSAGKVRVESDVRLPGPGLMSVTLDGVEQLRYTTEEAQTEQNLLYIGAGNQPLLTALRAVDSVVLYQADALPQDLSPYAMVIVDDTVVTRQPDRPTLWIGNSGLETLAPLAQSDPDAWDKGHPLLADIDIKSLTLGDAYALRLPQDAQIAVTANGAPLLATAQIDGQPQAYLAFDPRQSNWQGRPELAILAAALHRALVPAQSLAPCTPAEPCYPDNRSLGNTAAPIEIADALVDGGTTTSLLPWALALALAAIALDTLLAMRGAKRLTAPAPLSLAALVLLGLALFNAPLPKPLAATRLIAIDVPQAERSDGLRLDERPILSGTPPRLALSGPSEIQALRNAAEAFELAAASVPPSQNGHILLGGPLNTRPALFGPAMPISLLPPSAPLAGEVVLRALEIEGAPLEGEPLPITLQIHALAPTEATLVLRLNGEVLTQSALEIAQGDTRVEALLPALPVGEAFIDAELILPAGLADLAENNTAGLWITAAAPRPIAVISPDQGHGEAFARLLRAEDLEVDVLYPDETPDYMRDWMRYGGIVLLNTPSIELLPHRQRMIQSMVNDYGLGLLILGGKNTFGPGGYYETPLEELSPVSARVPRESPEVAMVFVLDRSGSMQQPVGDAGNRLSLAKNATVSSLEHLNPQSQIGVVTFDAEASVVYPLQTFDSAAVEAALDKVDPGGGTSIYPGLVAAYDLLKTSESPAKHVIVMTDGLSQPGDWGSILRMMGEEGITVSGVAIGFGADVDAVKTIARLGRGSAHVSSDFAALPSILSQEAMMFASPVEEGESAARWTGVTAPFLRDMPAALPPVHGFVLTTPKDEANTAILTRDQDGNDMPLLAWWRVGNGQVLALTTDATSDWTRDWHGLDAYGALFANALRAFHPPLPPAGLSLDLHAAGDTVTVTLSAISRDGAPVNNFAPRAEVLYCTGLEACTVSETLPLTFDGPGLFSGAFAPEAAGRYKVTLAQDSMTTFPLALGEPMPALPEASYYLAWPSTQDPTRESGIAAALAQQSGGRETSLAALRADLAQTTWQARPAILPWAIAALTLFMIELIRRYSGLSLRLRRRSPLIRASEGQSQ